MGFDEAYWRKSNSYWSKKKMDLGGDKSFWWIPKTLQIPLSFPLRAQLTAPVNRLARSRLKKPKNNQTKNHLICLKTSQRNGKNNYSSIKKYKNQNTYAL